MYLGTILISYVGAYNKIINHGYKKKLINHFSFKRTLRRQWQSLIILKIIITTLVNRLAIIFC